MKKKHHSQSDEHETFLRQIASLWPLAKGSLSEVRKPCARTNCPACARGDKHPAWIFTFMDNGRRRCMHVPRPLVRTLAKAIKNGRRLEQRLARMGEELIRRYRKQRKTKG